MKKIVFIMTLALSAINFAGPGHGHKHAHEEGHGHFHAAPDVTKEKTRSIGKHHIARLLKEGKLDASWAHASYDNSVLKTAGKKKEWLVTFNNAKSTKGKKLYIFLRPSGSFIAANFSGK